jgi:hypothetical protein
MPNIAVVNEIYPTDFVRPRAPFFPHCAKS